MRLAACFALAACAAACSGGNNNNGNPDSAVPHDMATGAGDMFLLSQCGHYGDPGNSIGVGKFCMTIDDCTQGNMQTNLCTAIGNAFNMNHADDTYFCTIYPCHQDGGVAACGENATCVCGSGGGQMGCACTPNYCLGGNSDGGTTD